MGYTHYWRKARAATPGEWDNFTGAVRAILAVPSLSGLVQYESDDASPVQADSNTVRFNGKGDDGHETFVIGPEACDFDFCKTARKPYDLVVCLVLLAAQATLPCKVSSDGDWSDEWQRARLLYREIFGKEPQAIGDGE